MIRRASLLLLAFVTSQAYAISNNAGTTNGDFLRIGTDARGVSLGDSAVSMARGADALRWNPGALGLVDSKEVSATDIEYYQNVRIDNLSAVYPMEEGGLGASLFYLSPGSLDGRDLQGNPTGNFSFYDMVGTLAYGHKMLSRAEGADISVGAAVKLVQEKIGDQSFTNPAFDVGILASPKENLNIALNVRDLSSGSADFVREIITGASYTIYQVFTGAFAVNYSNDSPVRYSVGGEYKLTETDYDTAARVGYETHDSLDNSLDSKIPSLRSGGIAGLTMGGGLGFTLPTFSAMKLNIDYAMAPFGALGISHTVTLKVKW
jgi:hypothetical protein